MLPGPGGSRPRVEVSDAILKDQFDRYSQGGFIDTANFMRMMQEISEFEGKQRPNYMQCLYIMTKYDLNKDGKLDFQEFKELITQI